MDLTSRQEIIFAHQGYVPDAPKSALCSPLGPDKSGPTLRTQSLQVFGAAISEFDRHIEEVKIPFRAQ
jgi:hypothetical protein